MIEEESLQDSRGKYHGVADRGVKGIDDGNVGVVAPVCLVHPLPQPRVLVLPVPIGEANLREDVSISVLPG